MTSRPFPMAVALTLASSVVAAGAMPSDVGAEGEPVGSDGSRAWVTGYRAGGTTWFDPPQGVDASGNDLECHNLVIEDGGRAEEGGGLLDWPLPDLSRKPVMRYWLRCYRDGAAVLLGPGDLGYLYDDEIIDFDAIVRTFAESFFAEHVGPSAAVQMSPPVGLVGVEQWFWLEGYDGAPVDQVHDVVGHRVHLTLELAELRWSFGNGSDLVFSGTDGLGRPGEQGAITHIYQNRSTSPAHPSGNYPVSARVVVSIRYTLDGAGPYTVDPPLQSVSTAMLVVREAQAVVSRG